MYNVLGLLFCLLAWYAPVDEAVFVASEVEVVEAEDAAHEPEEVRHAQGFGHAAGCSESERVT